MKLLPPVVCAMCQINEEHTGCRRAMICRLCGSHAPEGFGFIDGDRFCEGDHEPDCLTMAAAIKQEQEQDPDGGGDSDDDDSDAEGDPEDGEGSEDGDGTDSDSEDGSEGEDGEGDDADSDGEDGSDAGGAGAADGGDSPEYSDPDADGGPTGDTRVTYREFDAIKDMARLMAEANKRAR